MQTELLQIAKLKLHFQDLILYYLWIYSILWIYSLTLQVMVMIWLNRCINYISGQTTGLDHAHFHSDSALYPDSSFQSDSGLSQGGTDSGLHPHSCLRSWQQFPVWQWSIPRWYWQLSTILTVVSSLSDYSPQHSPHSYFHVIFPLYE